MILTLTVKDSHFTFSPEKSAIFVRGKRVKLLWLKDRIVVVDVINSLLKLGSSGKKVRTLSTQMDHTQLVERHDSLNSQDREYKKGLLLRVDLKLCRIVHC
jgi:flagellar biogenesis protein FliO